MMLVSYADEQIPESLSCTLVEIRYTTTWGEVPQTSVVVIEFRSRAQ